MSEGDGKWHVSVDGEQEHVTEDEQDALREAKRLSQYHSVVQVVQPDGETWFL